VKHFGVELEPFWNRIFLNKINRVQYSGSSSIKKNLAA